MKALPIFFIMLIACSVIPVSECTEFSVGVAPPVVEIGELEKGSSRIVKFNIVTVSSDPLLVYMTPARGELDFFLKNSYKNLIYNFSEQDTSGWVELFSNPVELIPDGNVVSNIKALKEISVLLSLPENAESGYHVISVKPSPYVPEGSSGPVGAMVVAVTSVNFLFNIKGKAIREGTILDVVNGGYSYSGFKLETYFRNSGTVTMSVRSHHKIYSKSGELMAEGASSVEYIPPHETRLLEAPIMAKLPPGEYDIVTEADFSTGTVQKNSTITLERPLSPAAVAEEPHIDLIPWIFFLIIIIISVLIYRRR